MSEEDKDREALDNEVAEAQASGSIGGDARNSTDNNAIKKTSS